MKREVRFILNEEEITCIGDIRKAKDTAAHVRTRIASDSISIEVIDLAFEVIINRLNDALSKLEIEVAREE